MNYNTLGDPFTHPLAHVHVSDESHPRFSLDGGTSGNVIVDYLEFLYRNYVFDDWLNWAKRQWLNQEGADLIDEEADTLRANRSGVHRVSVSRAGNIRGSNSAIKEDPPRCERFTFRCSYERVMTQRY